jgi:hypothetical protein
MQTFFFLIFKENKNFMIKKKKNYHYKKGIIIQIKK